MVAAAVCALALPTFAGEMGIMIKDPYSRSAGPNAKTGAAFFGIMNRTGQDDRLIAASSDIAKRVELHTHIETADGIMQMRKVEDGFPVEAGGMHMLARGGDHVMFMGLTRPMVQGEMVTVTLTFEVAGDIVVEIPVDLERKPAEGTMKMDHKMPSN
jgi:copper(I)-binding protein